MADQSAPERETIVPLSTETLHVASRQLERSRVRVEKIVRTQDVTVDEWLKSEQVTVERVPVGRVVETVPAPREEGDTLVIPLLEEELVIERRLVLREEIRIRKNVVTRPHHETIEVREEDVTVTRRDTPETSYSSPEEKT